MNKIILMLCMQSNKGIDKGVKNKVIETMNQEEFQMVPQNIDKFIDKQSQKNRNEIQQKNKWDERERKDENSQDTMNDVIIPRRIIVFYKRIANQITDQLLLKTRKEKRNKIKKSKNYE